MGAHTNSASRAASSLGLGTDSRLKAAAIALSIAVVVAWATAVLGAGRVLPWQADRAWAAIFAAVLAPAVAWFWGFSSRSLKAAGSGGRWVLAMLWGANPLSAVAVASLLLVYGSDTVNAVVGQPWWRSLMVLNLAMVAVVTWEMQGAALSWLRGEGAGAGEALLGVAARHSDAAILVALVVVGTIQASAIAMPIGDDIGHYTDVADAFLTGKPYPIHIVNQQLQSSGMGAAYPALPVFPLLLALSFAIFGHTMVGVAMPTVVATVLFPIALFAALRSIIGSRPVAYAATLLLFLFPAYRLHAVGSPEPDTVFVDLLLAAAAFAGIAARGTAWGWWAGFGAALGLATLTRPEGVPYAAALFAIFLLARWRQRGYWLAVAAFVAVLLPFMAVHYSIAGTPWPSTFGGSLLSLRNLETNLAMLRWPAFPWYAQAVGVSPEVLLGLIVAAGLVTIVGVAALWKQRGVLVAVPLAGLANLAVAFLVSPTVLGAYSPVDALRHLSYGIPYAAVGTAYAAALGARSLTHRAGRRELVILACFVLTSAYLVDEAERLARPEPYFGGRASLLWTGGGVLLADLAAHPMEFPWSGDPRPWETVRVELGAPLEQVDLRQANRSEPYHWSSLLATLLGLAYAAAPSVASRAADSCAPPRPNRALGRSAQNRPTTSN